MNKLCATLLLSMTVSASSLAAPTLCKRVSTVKQDVSICAYYTANTKSLTAAVVLEEIQATANTFPSLLPPGEEISCIIPAKSNNAFESVVAAKHLLFLPATWSNTMMGDHSGESLFWTNYFGHDKESTAQVILEGAEKNFSSAALSSEKNPVTPRAIFNHEFGHLLFEHAIDTISSTSPAIKLYQQISKSVIEAQSEENLDRKALASWYDWCPTTITQPVTLPLKILMEGYYGFKLWKKGDRTEELLKEKISTPLEPLRVDLVELLVTTHSELFADLIAVLQQEDLNAISKALSHHKSYSPRSFECSEEERYKEHRRGIAIGNIKHDYFTPVRCALGSYLQAHPEIFKSAAAKENFASAVLQVLLSNIASIGDEYVDSSLPLPSRFHLENNYQRFNQQLSTAIQRLN